ncbi:putative epoxide hydrolase-related protein [Acidisarcina polymorpha]|uniref:Putative epoxide hydrolase-related protein n=1 Tax=Acidisarcina polymorpha TaxID=2211140 RepID=A0A2Z5FSX1_9BACT|nr:alpha/beta fold hydrolase [Acidisarcina polymorpha]AXC09585.1 putative epoxide hydrolase-related protein [Acidisarcina polymorpha]
MSDAVTTRLIDANHLRFEVMECGEGEKFALCLHGFPEHAISWRAQMPALAAAGYRVWAVNQRGYGRSSRPQKVNDYSIEKLMADVAGLIDQATREFNPREVALLGHDWGAAIAWFFAMRRLRPIDALVILNVPHPACFRAALRHWRQLRKSWYIGFFQIPLLPDLLLRAAHGKAVERMFLRSSCHPEYFSSEILAVYRENVSQPGAATAMIDWYRAFARGGFQRQMRMGFPRIDTRTLVIWGLEDVALDPITLHGTERYVTDYTLRTLPGFSHWVQQEAPEVVSAMITAFLAKHRVPTLQAFRESAEAGRAPS